MTGTAQVSDQPVFADAGRRLAAHLIDVGFSLVPFALALVIGRTMLETGIWVLKSSHTGADPRVMWAGFGPVARWAVIFEFFVGMGLVYITLFHASPWQATFGKRIMGIYVASDKGERIGVLRSFGRGFIKFILSVFGGSLISLITIAASQRRKALHDFVARTVVVRGRPLTTGPLEFWRVAAAVVIPIVWILTTNMVLI
jgi:uncharacterized RDD family membrane protein YckC